MLSSPLLLLRLLLFRAPLMCDAAWLHVCTAVAVPRDPRTRRREQLQQTVRHWLAWPKPCAVRACASASARSSDTGRESDLEVPEVYGHPPSAGARLLLLMLLLLQVLLLFLLLFLWLFLVPVVVPPSLFFLCFFLFLFQFPFLCCSVRVPVAHGVSMVAVVSFLLFLFLCLCGARLAISGSPR